MDRTFFIVNPVAGSGRAKAGFEALQARLDAMGADYGFAYSQYPGHTAILAREAIAAGEKRIVSVGGDGTANEAASALVNTGVTLGLMPLGTGNDLAKVIYLPTDPDGIIEMLKAGRTRPMDAGEANGRVFINVSGLGFDVDVLQKTEKYKKGRSGMGPYLLGIADALVHLRTLNLTLYHDGVTEKLCGVIVTVGNGQYFGGGMRAVPTGDPFDGLLDVCAIEKVGLLRFITLLPGFIKGRHYAYKPVRHFRTAELRVECEEESMLDLDGEVDLSTPATFKVLPGAIKLLVPAEGEGR